MKYLTTWLLWCVLSTLFAVSLSKLPDPNEDDDDGLLSKKTASKEDDESDDEGACEAGDILCNLPAHNYKSTSQMMEDSSDALVKLYNKYGKDFLKDGKLDWDRILSSEYAGKFMKLFLQGTMPGGNPTIAAGVKVFQTVTKQLGVWEKGLKTKGLDLKAIMDELHEVINKVVPGLVIAVQHADRKCKRQALCRVSRTAADIETKSELPQAVSLFLCHIAGTYLDATEKKKKEYGKIVECCSSSDKAIHKKCSAKYLDADDCDSERLLSPSMLQPIDYTRIDFLKTFLPKF